MSAQARGRADACAAATEHGVQGDTTTIGIELASPATTRRGAYVGLTRGIEANIVLVVTESRDLDEARDILDRIITTDRADVPATTQRRELAAADRSPARPTPRCEVPDWLPDLRTDIAQQLADLETRALHHQAELGPLQQRLAALEQQLFEAQRRLAPHEPGLVTAHAATIAAQERCWTTYGRSLHLKGRHRRAADREHRDAQQELTEAKAHESALRDAAAPACIAVHDAASQVGDVREQIRSIELFQRYDGSPQRTHELRSVLRAVEDWERWAAGTSMSSRQIGALIETLRSDAATEQPDCASLATAVEHWARPRGIVPPATVIATPNPPVPLLEIDL